MNVNTTYNVKAKQNFTEVVLDKIIKYMLKSKFPVCDNICYILSAVSNNELSEKGFIQISHTIIR